MDELNRAMEDALRVVGVVVEDKMLVPGGGAPEVELALRLREYAATVGGREQLAIEAFADSMEVIPKTLAENAGLDQIDSLVALRSQHEKGVTGAAAMHFIVYFALAIYSLDPVMIPSPLSDRSIPSFMSGSIVSFDFPRTAIIFQGCRFFGDGAHMPARRIFRSISSGISCFLNRRILRLLKIISSMAPP